jgi:prepilin-type N-terminal cleavage/methylation domain-containing protein
LHERRSRYGGRGRGFSLIELVIVVVIIAILGAIAIPKMSRGAQGASDASLSQNLATLRSGLDLYQAEHSGTFPAAGVVVAAMTTYTDDQGNTSATKTGNFVYGPYVRALPPLPVGNNKGNTGIDIAANAGNAGVGWIYNPANGTITANTTTEADAKGVLYSSY